MTYSKMREHIATAIRQTPIVFQPESSKTRSARFRAGTGDSRRTWASCRIHFSAQNAGASSAPIIASRLRRVIVLERITSDYTNGSCTAMCTTEQTDAARRHSLDRKVDHLLTSLPHKAHGQIDKRNGS